MVLLSLLEFSFWLWFGYRISKALKKLSKSVDFVDTTLDEGDE